MIVDDWLLAPQRLAVHVPTRTAVLADLHLGYHFSRRRAGDAVPLPRLDEQLRPLGEARVQFGFETLVIAGDLLERACPADLIEEWRGWLERHGLHVRAIVPGNHDRELPEGLGPIHRDGFILGDWRVVHGDGDMPAGRVVMGHWHPSVRRRGRKLPCFLARADVLVLPAFTREAAGAVIRGKGRWRSFRCYAVHGDKVVDVGEAGNKLT